MPPILKRFILQKNLEAIGKERAKLLPQFLEAGQKTSPFLFVSCISVDFISFKSKLISFQPFFPLTLTHNIGKTSPGTRKKSMLIND